MNNTLQSKLLLHVLTDKALSRGRDMVTVSKAALEGGATVIQLRDKTASTRLLVEEGQALRSLTREYGALLIVNDRIDVALAIEADGAHIGQDDDMPIDLARKLLGPERILGVSAGNLLEAQRAVSGGADYLGVGPIYATMTKTDAGSPIGLSFLTELASRYQTPLIAIGGIKIENANEIMKAGATGIAVISTIVSADDISNTTRRMRSALS